MTAKRIFTAVAASVLALAVCMCCFMAACSSPEGEDYVPEITDIRFDSDSYTVHVGEKMSLNGKISVTLADGEKYQDRFGGLVWETDNESIMTVERGYVTGISRGSATVTCRSAADGSIYASCEVRVANENLVVGIKDDVEDFGYEVFPGEYEGFEIELGRMLAEALGSEPEYVVLSSAERTEALQSGKVDCVIATFTITDERAQEVNFSSPYYTDYVQMLVTDEVFEEGTPFTYESRGTGSALTDMLYSLRDYEKATGDGRKLMVGTVEGTTAEDACDDFCRAIVDEDYDLGSLGQQTYLYEYCEYETFGSYREAADALESGEIDAFCGDHSILRGYQEKDMTFLDDIFEAQDYGVATAKTDIVMGEEDAETTDSYTQEINALIDLWLLDGTIDAMLARYGLTRTLAAE